MPVETSPRSSPHYNEESEKEDLSVEFSDQEFSTSHLSLFDDDVSTRNMLVETYQELFKAYGSCEPEDMSTLSQFSYGYESTDLENELYDADFSSQTGMNMNLEE